MKEEAQTALTRGEGHQPSATFFSVQVTPPPFQAALDQCPGDSAPFQAALEEQPCVWFRDTDLGPLLGPAEQQKETGSSAEQQQRADEFFFMLISDVLCFTVSHDHSKKPQMLIVFNVNHPQGPFHEADGDLTIVPMLKT